MPWEHHGDNEWDLNNGDANRQYESAIRFTRFMGYHLSMMDSREHAANEDDCHDCNKPSLSG
jgi:hypothetical protein